jgi:uncharacterized protein with ParB-like and HNH nuclease domain
MGQFEAPKTISKVIEWMNTNSILIPAFQREYVWSHIKVENLFDSLMRGYPINSMLFWHVTGTARSSYQFYEFLRCYIEHHQTHNVPLTGCVSKESFLAVLDGQQRLTSLYLGLCGSYAYHTKYKPWENNNINFPERKLYLNLSKKGIDSNNDGRIFQFKFLTGNETNNYANIVIINNEKWFRVGHVLNLETISVFANSNQLTIEETIILETLHKRINTDQVINYYQEDTVSADEAVNIFIRVNAGGTYLSLSDILMSMLRAGWTIDARKEIQNITDRVASNGFQISNDYIIKALLFLKSQNISNRIQNFDNNFIDKTQKEWSNIANCIDELFKTLKIFQLNHSTLLSYNATLPILYYLYHRNIYTDFSNKKQYARNRHIVKMWLLKTLLLKSFGGHSDSVLTNARKALLPIENHAVFPADDISRAIHQPSTFGLVEVDDLLDIRKDDRMAFLVLALLYPDYNGIELEKDHMHPLASYDDYKSMIGSKALDISKYDSIVNLQFIPSSENRSKGDTSLKDWAKLPQSKIYKKYYPKVDLSLSSFNKFYTKRKKILEDTLIKLLSTPS